MKGYPLAAFLDSALGRARALLPRLRRGPRSAGEDMFGRIRRRLTLWYSLVLFSALLLCGVILYISIDNVFIGTIKSNLTYTATSISNDWQSFPIGACRIPPALRQSFYYLACFDANGNQQQISFYDQQAPPNFASQELAIKVIQTGSILDRVDVGNSIGVIERYAMAVPDPTSDNNGVLGVVEVGLPIDPELSILHGLLVLLLTVGALALLAATVGGLFLARRALAPARLAFARQQSFIADASHELRTPLTLLRADAEVLLRGADRLTPDDRFLLDDIVAETAHMTALAGTMLTLARLDAGRLHLERDVVDLAAVAARTGRRADALAREKGVAIQVEGVEPLLVIGDRMLLEQVALILVDNAIKYNHPDGQVILRTSSDGTKAVLEVCDTGIGIAQEHLPHLGERFYRVDKARSREGGGAGLGLSIARSVASAHGGTLSLSSTPGAGTTARLSVPAAVEKSS